MSAATEVRPFARPRLADHALMRRHTIDGGERVVIHHASTGALVALDPRSAELTLLADGTRDLDGIALAASRAGLFARQSELDELFAALANADLLADGIAPPAAILPTTPLAPSFAALPVEVLPDYRFTCTGAGACCMQYASIVFGEEDRERARGFFAELPGEARADRVHLPLQSDDATRTAMTLVDGACLQLDAERRCGLHRRGGFEAKPAACRAYPATFVIAGDRVSVSTSVECDCVLTSLSGDSGEPLVTATTGAELPAGLRVRELPAEISWVGDERVPRDRYLDFRREALALVPSANAVCVALSLAKSLRDGAPYALVSSTELDPLVHEPLAAFARAMTAAAEAADSWRSARDRTRLMRREVASAASTLARRGLGVLDSSPFAEAESFTLRAALFGHALADEAPVAALLVDLAVRLLVARELELSGRRALGHPIAVVMAAARGALRNEPSA
ncbi:MAG: YkgJ family cysteine cluster protein [Myxococcales bacterium]|nr:YkgJ family cysteine cluster protein [Myxococcales bacterium]